MQKVITINLNGNAFQLDESGYEALRALSRARRGAARRQSGQGRDHPRSRAVDRGEVPAASRTGQDVVTTAEVEQILREIGPVESGPGSAASSHRCGSAASAPQPKRLYQIREGAMVSGVCNGLAAYFNLDPTIVRVAFVVGGRRGNGVTDDPPVVTVVIYVLLVFLRAVREDVGRARRGARRVRRRFRTNCSMSWSG